MERGTLFFQLLWANWSRLVLLRLKRIMLPSFSTNADFPGDNKSSDVSAVKVLAVHPKCKELMMIENIEQ